MSIATLENEHTATLPLAIDPDTFEEVGGFLWRVHRRGDFRGTCPLHQRPDRRQPDRVEAVRAVPAARGGRQKNGSLPYWPRAAPIAGTGRIDNFGLYSITPSSMPEVDRGQPGRRKPGSQSDATDDVCHQGWRGQAGSGFGQVWSSTAAAAEGITVSEIKIGAEDGHQVTYQVTELLAALSDNSFKLTFTRGLR